MREDATIEGIPLLAATALWGVGTFIGASISVYLLTKKEAENADA